MFEIKIIEKIKGLIVIFKTTCLNLAQTMDDILND